MKSKSAQQISFFPQGNDLPLFSGTAQSAQLDPFKATPPAPKQPSLFEMPKKETNK